MREGGSEGGRERSRERHQIGTAADRERVIIPCTFVPSFVSVGELLQ